MKQYTLKEDDTLAELSFWAGFVKTERFLKGWVEKIKTPELQQIVYDFIKSYPNAKVVDVGSGVCSILNGTVPDEMLTVVDPLGDLYAQIFDYEAHNVKKPIKLPGEGLHILGENKYDIVHASNSLDHSENPKRMLENMFTICKPAGSVVIQCFENEAIYEKYQGFHQFNLTMTDKLIHMEDKDGNKEALTGDFEVTTAQKITFERKTWLIWIARKN